jgi:hypothetical protein
MYLRSAVDSHAAISTDAVNLKYVLSQIGADDRYLLHDRLLDVTSLLTTTLPKLRTRPSTTSRHRVQQHEHLSRCRRLIPSIRSRIAGAYFMKVGK